ncbi:diaminobutyrate--2-oxoglutarate transaminase [Haliangium sp.]|uniref:diaminobutyrate--2-oxoglutarate transaminase n=1 Tax=Haliangium sp. TaxID=2663208 RepID=UPI003D0EB220
MDIFAQLESDVRSYCRSFPTVFTRSRGSCLYDEHGARYIDFFAGAGVLNYGHNDPRLKRALIDYIESDGIIHSLDMATAAKRRLLERFQEVILAPRGLSYKVQFPGPTGTNAVEAALKLARKVTGRHSVVSFTNAFHGMTLGSLSLSGNAFKRTGAGVPLNHGVVMPFDDYFDDGRDTIGYLEALVIDRGSGVDKPAAVIVETIQAEGGIHVASARWLRALAGFCREHEILLVVDDIQVGCGRTGPFFSFERAGIEPDIVCLSKSLSGYGLPLALTLLKPELDAWSPGEHNGTFRGHNPAFVTAAAALDYWTDDALEREVDRKGELVAARLHRIAARHPELGLSVRGRGLMQGLVAAPDDLALAGELSRACFARGLIAETAGPSGEVFKIMPPLVIEDQLLSEGMDIVDQAVAELAARRLPVSHPGPELNRAAARPSAL